MFRTPRYALLAAAVALGATIALVAASGATGRSQAKPHNTKEPFIGAPFLVEVGTSLSGNKGSWSGTAPISYYTAWQRCTTPLLPLTWASGSGSR